MRKLRLGAAAAVIAAVAALFPSPASAHTFTDVAVFAGAAGVGGGSVGNGGLFFPAALPCGGVCPLENHNYNFSSSGGAVGLDVIVGTSLVNPGIDAVGAGRITGNGNLVGYCGGSISLDLTVGFAGHSVSGGVFVTVGGTGVAAAVEINGDHTAEAVAATFQARPLPSVVGQVPCLTEGANVFQVVGAGGGLGA